MSGEAERTGRSRFRVVRGWWKPRLVFQVEWTGRVTRLLGPHPDTNTETWWADARVEDLTDSKWEIA